MGPPRGLAAATRALGGEANAFVLSSRGSKKQPGQWDPRRQQASHWSWLTPGPDLEGGDWERWAWLLPFFWRNKDM